MLHVLQICNVGNILGGTAACAWSVTRALPDCRHTVWFRTAPSRQTCEVFSNCEIGHQRQFSRQDFAGHAFDIVLLHNVSARWMEWGTQRPQLSIPVLQYQHSFGARLAAGDRRVLCSRALAEQTRQHKTPVMHQGVPRSRAERPDTRRLSSRLIVGRICTPSAKKWPAWIPEFYTELAKSRPDIDWEFVGCPRPMQSALKQAVNGQARFFAPGWQARKHLRDWHVLLYHQPGVKESFGRVCAEALRTGCVPIVDRQGGFVEQLPEGTGLLAAKREEFGAALDRLSNPEEWAARSSACRGHGDNHFSLQAFRGRLLEQFVYTGL